MEERGTSLISPTWKSPELRLLTQRRLRRETISKSYLISVMRLCEKHEAQLINYLKATEIEVGLLLNFGKKAEFRRKIFTNDKK